MIWLEISPRKSQRVCKTARRILLGFLLSQKFLFQFFRIYILFYHIFILIKLSFLGIKDFWQFYCIDTMLWSSILFERLDTQDHGVDTLSSIYYQISQWEKCPRTQCDCALTKQGHRSWRPVKRNQFSFYNYCLDSANYI